MAAYLSRLSQKLVRIFASQACWYVILTLFVCEAVWMALSAQYPMAFDERYHFGLIQLHAQQWKPYFTSQPETGAYGAIVRDPSYLYHWLMSYPYRLIAHITHDQTAQIIFLRIINVGLFTGALVLYRRILRRLRVSNAFTHASLLAFILIPVVPLLAATINYDNLIMVVVPGVTLLTLDVLDDCRVRRISFVRLGVLCSLLLLGSLVKYPFLPVLAVVAGFVLWRCQRSGLFTAKALRTAWSGLRMQHWAKQALVLTLLAISVGLFCERYAVNMIDYHTPVPACNEVIPASLCQQYGPWQRDDDLKRTKQSKQPAFHPNILTYAGDWLYGMWYRLFFAVGPEPGYDTKSPLYLMSRGAIVTAILISVGIIIRCKDIFRNHPDRVLLLLLIVVYGLTLFGDNYLEYVHTGETVAINGRYWIPFLPLLFALGAFAWKGLVQRAAYLKVLFASLMLGVLLLQGGGTMTYIVSSNPDWYWPNATVRAVNGRIKRDVSPFIYHT